MFQSEIRKDFRHNFTVNVLDGTFFGLGLGFASSVTVIPLFINSLTDSTTLIGLIASIQMIGWQLPQLLTSNRVAGLSLYRPMVMRMTIHERWPFFGLAVVALLIPLVAPAVALALTFIMLSWHALGGGFTATAWQAMIGKIMPEHRRGTFYGVQAAGLSLLQSIGAVLAGIILARLPYPYNFSLCFFLAIVAMLISQYFLWRTREPEGPPVEKRRDWGDFRHNLQVILQRDGNFRWFLLARGLAQVAFMAIGFFTIYGVRNFALGAEAAGFMTGLMLLAQMATSPAVGWIGDKWGHRRVFAGGLLILGLSIFTIMSATDVLWFYLAFALAGIANGVLWTSVLTITVEFGTELDRPYYIGLANTLIAPATLLAPIIGGALVDAISFQAMFTLAMGAALLTAVVLLVLTHDPRTRRVPTVAPGD